MGGRGHAVEATARSRVGRHLLHWRVEPLSKSEPAVAARARGDTSPCAGLGNRRSREVPSLTLNEAYNVLQRTRARVFVGSLGLSWQHCDAFRGVFVMHDGVSEDVRSTLPMAVVHLVDQATSRWIWAASQLSWGRLSEPSFGFASGVLSIMNLMLSGPPRCGLVLSGVNWRQARHDWVVDISSCCLCTDAVDTLAHRHWHCYAHRSDRDHFLHERLATAA